MDGPDQDDGLAGRGEVEKEVPQVQILPRDPAAILPPRAQRERPSRRGGGVSVGLSARREMAYRKLSDGNVIRVNGRMDVIEGLGMK